LATANEAFVTYNRERQETDTKMNRIALTPLLTISALLLSACQPAVYLMPTPTAISTGSADPFADTPEQEQGSNILVGYATNRQPFGAKKSRFYSRDFDEDLRLGVATIQIGDGDKSWQEIRELSVSNERDQKIRLSLAQVEEMGTLEADASLDELTPQMAQLMRDFNRAIDRSPTRDITIYVHGANNNFYRTASQAAQFRHFTGRRAIIVLYSWPSAESIARYGTDIRNIRSTVPVFARFIRLLAEHTTARRINILAYSAGATLATEALDLIGKDKTITDRSAYRDKLRLGVIYFAAPDTDFDSFVDEYRNYHDLVDKVTITVNPNDTVLGIAQEDRRWKAYGGMEEYIRGATTKSRLGRPDTDDISSQDLNWLIQQMRAGKIDVINIDPASIPGLGKGDHDFWYKNPWVSTDVLLDIILQIPPAERGLIEVIGERGGKLWAFPTDYEQRVNHAIMKLSEEYRRNPTIPLDQSR
jgi:esterase/lipase superfamily enzyme